MGFCTCKVLVILLCVGSFALQQHKVSGLNSIELVLRWSKEHGQAREFKPRMLKDMAVQNLNNKEKAGPPPSSFGSSKRRVRRGSDPIHNSYRLSDCFQKSRKGPKEKLEASI
ncbi:CLAVATA3/ESR (CLE)-related protein 45 [Aristolochia californica]|uniref:CLAVATA3/ESR (CLE)-related protein 45 n=1 Tax=Aristolochia californica TaxID=171875 RepID=UPI0035DE1D94